MISRVFVVTDIFLTKNSQANGSLFLPFVTLKQKYSSARHKLKTKSSFDFLNVCVPARNRT